MHRTNLIITCRVNLKYGVFSDLNAVLLLSGQFFCSSLLNVSLFREEGGKRSLSLSNSLALAALERSRSVELAILYQIEWKHVESGKDAVWGCTTAHARMMIQGLGGACSVKATKTASL